MQRMQRPMILVLLCGFAAPALAQTMEFAKIRENSPVELVLGTGGECRGKVTRRVEGVLSIMLTASNPDCGARGNLVTVRQESVQSVERIKVSGPSTRRKIIAVAAAFGIGMLIPRVAPVAMLGVGAGGAEAVHIMNRDMDRSDGARRGGYTIYVSRLERDAAASDSPRDSKP